MGAGIGPFAECGLEEAFGLAVGQSGMSKRSRSVISTLQSACRRCPAGEAAGSGWPPAPASAAPASGVRCSRASRASGNTAPVASATSCSTDTRAHPGSSDTISQDGTGTVRGPSQKRQKGKPPHSDRQPHRKHHHSGRRDGIGHPGIDLNAQRIGGPSYCTRPSCISTTRSARTIGRPAAYSTTITVRPCALIWASAA